VSGKRLGAWFLSFVLQLSLRLRPLIAGEDENTMGRGSCRGRTDVDKVGTASFSAPPT